MYPPLLLSLKMMMMMLMNQEVEAQEPRFISSLTEINGRFDGLRVISPTEFEVVLYLNQMGEFNFIGINQPTAKISEYQMPNDQKSSADQKMYAKQLGQLLL